MATLNESPVIKALRVLRQGEYILSDHGWRELVRGLLAELRRVQAPGREWVVFSTAIEECALMLECGKTRALGIVADPTAEEWKRAYSAPSAPYRWDGDPERVQVIRENTTVAGELLDSMRTGA